MDVKNTRILAEFVMGTSRYVPPKGLRSAAVTVRTADLRVQAGRPVRYLTLHYNINTHHPKYLSLPLKENFVLFEPRGGGGCGGATVSPKGTRYK
ncbi:hypothetical protein J6590_083793 [Homalodisca vitripennis]|nr:hypothetical protein J6590_083793 [Homalodisca vitripennis]